MLQDNRSPFTAFVKASVDQIINANPHGMSFVLIGVNFTGPQLEVSYAGNLPKAKYRDIVGKIIDQVQPLNS